MSDTNTPIVSAGFGVRFFAYIIDLLVRAALFFGVWLMFIPLRGTFLGNPVLFTFSALDIASYLLGVSYFVILTYFTGVTAGKFLLKLKVIGGDSTDEAIENPDFFNILYRETVGRYLSGILFVGYIMAIFNKKKLALHDILGETRVVYRI